jgi:hypothetical protein
MSSQYDQQSDCDAPPYQVVKACEELSFHSPLDVRWCRMSEFLVAPDAGPGMLEWLLGRSRPSEKRCSCGKQLPRLELYTFTFASGRKAIYFLGQCRRCHTTYWEKGAVVVK